MFHDPNEIYQKTSDFFYTINTLLSNPVIWFGNVNEELSNAGMLDFGIFRAKDLEIGLAGDDVLVILPKDSSMYPFYSQKEILNFRAFYLPFSTNNCEERIIPIEADIVVTPNLTGCSFIGELNTETPRVAHINRQNEEGNTDAATMEADIQRIVAKSNNKYFVVRKSDYYNTDEAITMAVFGFKSNHRWHYVCEKVGDNNILDCVSSVPIDEMQNMIVEQNARKKVIRYRDELYQHIIDHPSKNVSTHSITFLFKEKNALYKQKFSLKVSDDIHSQLTILENAEKGKIKWTAAWHILENQFVTKRAKPLSHWKAINRSIFSSSISDKENDLNLKEKRNSLKKTKNSR